MIEIKTDKQYKIYGENIEEGALKQFEDVMNIPWVVQGALMPDAHNE